MIGKIVKIGIVGLLAATLIGGSAYVVLRPNEVQAQRETGGRGQSGREYAAEPGGGKGYGAAEKATGQGAGGGNGKGNGAATASGNGAGQGRGQGNGQGAGSGSAAHRGYGCIARSRHEPVTARPGQCARASSRCGREAR